MFCSWLLLKVKLRRLPKATYFCHFLSGVFRPGHNCNFNLLVIFCIGFFSFLKSAFREGRSAVLGAVNSQQFGDTKGVDGIAKKYDNF